MKNEIDKIKKLDEEIKKRKDDKMRKETKESIDERVKKTKDMEEEYKK